MKNLSVIILILGFILAIYGSFLLGKNSSNTEKAALKKEDFKPLNISNDTGVVSNTKSEPTSLSFQRKQECAKYSTKIESVIDKNKKEDPSYFGSVKEIFYSPKLDSCVYIISSFWTNSAGKIISAEDLIDVLTSKLLLTKLSVSSYAEVEKYDRDLLLYR